VPTWSGERVEINEVMISGQGISKLAQLINAGCVLAGSVMSDSGAWNAEAMARKKLSVAAGQNTLDGLLADVLADELGERTIVRARLTPPTDQAGWMLGEHALIGNHGLLEAVGERGQRLHAIWLGHPGSLQHVTRID
jgi:hypothetical protein